MEKKLTDRPVLSGIYFLAIPLAAALQSSWFRLSQFESGDKALVFGWWAGLFLMFWWLTILSTQAIRYGLKFLNPPVWILWAAGPVIAAFVFHDFFASYFAYGHTILPEGGVRTVLPDSPFSLEYLKDYVIYAPPGIAFFVGSNALFDKVLGIPMFRDARTKTGSVSTPSNLTAFNRADRPQSSASSNTKLLRPSFMESLPLDKQGDLICIQAQEHFIKVYTDKGPSLVSWPFKKALAELSQYDGIQSHRSYWIAKDAFLGVEKNGHGYVANLKNGSSVPVSRTYLREVRNLATSSL